MSVETIYALRCKCGAVCLVCTNDGKTTITDAFEAANFAVEHQGGAHWLSLVGFDVGDTRLPPSLKRAAREASR